MKRLNTKNINTPNSTIQTFEGRWQKELNYRDWERFREMAKYFKGGRILDLGVFNSPLIIELWKMIKYQGLITETVGLDYCEPVLRELQQRHPEVRYVVGDAMHIQFKDEYFDYVIAGELIEHMEDPAAFVKEVMRVLKKGGVFSLSTPKEEGEKQIKISSEHLWSFDEQNMNNLLKPYGRVEISTKRVSLNVRTEHKNLQYIEIEQFIVHCHKK